MAPRLGGVAKGHRQHSNSMNCKHSAPARKKKRQLARHARHEKQGRLEGSQPTGGGRAGASHWWRARPPLLWQQHRHAGRRSGDGVGRVPAQASRRAIQQLPTAGASVTHLWAAGAGMGLPAWRAPGRAALTLLLPSASRPGADKGNAYNCLYSLVVGGRKGRRKIKKKKGDGDIGRSIVLVTWGVWTRRCAGSSRVCASLILLYSTSIPAFCFQLQAPPCPRRCSTGRWRSRARRTPRRAWRGGRHGA